MTLVKIKSHWASVEVHGTNTWEGEVPAEYTTSMEGIFRFFNRVDPDDEARLRRYGYRLPSLSVGDEVTVDGATWRCEPVGWSRIA